MVVEIVSEYLHILFVNSIKLYNNNNNILFFIYKYTHYLDCQCTTEKCGADCKCDKNCQCPGKTSASTGEKKEGCCTKT